MEDAWDVAQWYPGDSPTTAAASSVAATTARTTAAAAARVGCCTGHDGQWTISSAGWAAVYESGDVGSSAEVVDAAAATTGGGGGTAEYVDDGWCQWWWSAGARDGDGEDAYADSDPDASAAGDERQGCAEEGCAGGEEDGGATAVAFDFHDCVFFFCIHRRPGDFSCCISIIPLHILASDPCFARGFLFEKFKFSVDLEMLKKVLIFCP